MAAIAAIFASLGAWVAAEQDSLRRAVLAWVLPDDWLTAGDHLLRGFLRDHRSAMVNLLVTALLVLVPMLTFPLKERLSARFEARLHRDDPDWRAPAEQPLRIQALDEALLLLVFLALSLAALRVTVAPGWARIGGWLTHGVLAFTFAVDFIGPTLTRHHISPTAIYRVLFRNHPLQALGFGAVLSAPPLLTGRMLTAGDATDFALLAGVNTACLGVAALWGTALGTTIAGRQHTPPGAWFIGPFWALILTALAINGAYFGAAFRATLAVTPVLRCDWRPIADSFHLDLPGLLDPTLTVELSVDVHNPTGRRARIGENRVELFHRGRPVADTALPPFDVGAGETTRERLRLRFEPRGALWDKAGEVLADGVDGGWWSALGGAARGVADGSAWRVVLILPLPSGDLTVPLYGVAEPR